MGIERNLLLPNAMGVPRNSWLIVHGWIWQPGGGEIPLNSHDAHGLVTFAGFQDFSASMVSSLLFGDQES